MAADRDWRGSPVNRSVPGGGEGGSPGFGPSRSAAARPPWTRRLLRWAEDRFSAVFSEPGEAADEEVLHDFIQEISEASDADAVGAVLTLAARRLTGSNAVELVPGVVNGWDGSGAKAVIEARGRGGVWGSLILRGNLPPAAIVYRRLETLAVIAGSAFDRLDEADAVLRRASWSPEDPRRVDSDGAAEDTDLGFYPSAPAVHDATFLNAVFPFALSQARRHGESLSVLCVAIDRLGGIRDLLGSDQVDRTVRHTGSKIATLIRSSDIVARLDDDRLMVLLPRAELADGRTVARKLRQGVADNAGLLSDAPLLTLSIGVASYPECATDLYELLDAADAALSDAQDQGGDGVALAPAVAVDRDARRAPCAV